MILARIVLNGWFNSDADMRQRVGGMVRQLREECGLTQQQLADRADITNIYVSKIEGGKMIPSYEVIGRILEATKED